MAGGVIAALEAQGLAGQVPVSGQDGDQAALNRVALGTQTVDVWKDSRELGTAAGEAAVALCANPDIAAASRARRRSRRPGASRSARSCSTPIPITQDNLDVVLDAGWIDQGRRSARASRPARSQPAADRHLRHDAACPSSGSRARGTSSRDVRRRGGVTMADVQTPATRTAPTSATSRRRGRGARRSRRPRSTPACSAWSSPSPSSGSAFNILSGGDFLTARNLWNLSVQSTSIAIMATGMVLIIVSRNIDLSVGSLLGFLGYVMAHRPDRVDPRHRRSTSASDALVHLDRRPRSSASPSAPRSAARRGSSSPTSASRRSSSRSAGSSSGAA